MAITYTTVATDRGVNGLHTRVVDITMSDVSVDYVPGAGAGKGVALPAAKMGLTRIVGGEVLSVRTAANAFRPYRGLVDHVNQQVHLFEALTGQTIAAAAEVEVDGTDIVDGDIVRVLIVGVGP